ncbi:MAG TPA: DUF72 domain-containing protein [Solirubrobacterales bacterium]|nr:DUF72 domain-containing protein [Solirubrobacterales bacterium]
MRSVRVGCAGWAYKEWRGPFYPEKLPQREWLRHYSAAFETVEVNSTFYRLPSEKTVKEWVEQSPGGFGFAVKASRYITHVKKLNSPEKYVERFLAGIEPLTAAGKLEAVLWQLPPSLRRNDERLDAALEAILARAPGRHAVEFRHPSWFTADVYALLRERAVALVIADNPEFPFGERELTADWTYIRFHRGGLGKDAGYSARELATWRRRIAKWREDADVLAYFNNDPTALGVDGAQALRRGLD